jgi:hypothetical protein
MAGDTDAANQRAGKGRALSPSKALLRGAYSDPNLCRAKLRRISSATGRSSSIRG